MQKSPLEQYQDDMRNRVESYETNNSLRRASREFFEAIGIGQADYVYNFFWLGVPIIQIPQDLQAMQELIWEAKPELIIETGIAWGGTLVFSASMLAILEACDVIEKGEVVGVDIDIRAHNRQAIMAHPLGKRITMLQGSSVDQDIVRQVKEYAKKYQRVMVCLDSNHSHNHVLAELEAYAPCVSRGSYCVVGDTVIEDAPKEMTAKRPWGKGNSPKTAVWEYLSRLEKRGWKGEDGADLRFEMNRTIEHKIAVTGSPDGFLRRV